MEEEGVMLPGGRGGYDGDVFLEDGERREARRARMREWQELLEGAVLALPPTKYLPPKGAKHASGIATNLRLGLPLGPAPDFPLPLLSSLWGREEAGGVCDAPPKQISEEPAVRAPGVGRGTAGPVRREAFEEVEEVVILINGPVPKS